MKDTRENDKMKSVKIIEWEVTLEILGRITSKPKNRNY